MFFLLRFNSQYVNAHNQSIIVSVGKFWVKKGRFLVPLAVFEDPAQQNLFKINLMCLSCIELTADMSHVYNRSNIISIVQF